MQLDHQKFRNNKRISFSGIKRIKEIYPERRKRKEKSIQTSLSPLTAMPICYFNQALLCELKSTARLFHFFLNQFSFLWGKCHFYEWPCLARHTYVICGWSELHCKTLLPVRIEWECTWVGAQRELSLGIYWVLGGYQGRGQPLKRKWSNVIFLFIQDGIL